MKKIFIAVALIVLIMSPVAVRADLVSNGGFESGNAPWIFSQDSSMLITSGSGWGFPTGAHTGSYWFYGGAYNGVIAPLVQQNLTTTNGQNYKLEFWLANGQVNGISIPNYFEVQWNGATVNSFTNAAAFDWTKYSYNVTGTGGSNTLTFRFNQEPANWGLDDVSVNPVPIPAAIWLLGSGFLGLIGIRRKIG